MNVTRLHWAVTALAVAVAVLLTLFVVDAFRPAPGIALAQAAAGASGASALLGPQSNDRIPLFMVDTRSGTILVYEYTVSHRKLYLRVVRSYLSDRDMEDVSWGDGNPNVGPSVKEIQDLLRRGIR